MASEATSGRTPLDGVIGHPGGPADAGVVLQERRLLGKLVLRGQSDDPHFMFAVSGVLDGALPTAPNTTARHGAITVVWLGPDEWLLLTAPDAETALEMALVTALDGIDHAVTVTSDHSTVIRISGLAARAVMAKGCALDLHPRVFRPGNAAQSRLAKAGVAFWQVDDGPTYDIQVGASFAPYLWAWLNDAGKEFNVRVEC